MQTNTIQDIYNNSRKTMWIIIGAITLLVVVSILYAHFTHHIPTLHQDTKKATQAIDSNYVWRKQWEDTRYRDSIQSAVQLIKLTGIEQKVNKVPAMIQSINNRTNAQIHNITLLSDDQQLALFTNWISETDSL